jgi:hypothetical protein
MALRADRVCYPYVDLARESEVTGFRYVSSLLLGRTVSSLKARSGEDAAYYVAQPYQCKVQIDGGVWLELTVPQGLITDLASVPRAARTIVDRVGPHLEAAIVHDWLYCAWQDIPARGARRSDKEFADAVFLAGMKEAGVPLARRLIAYNAVSWFGWGAFSSISPARYLDVQELEDGYHG